MASSRQQASSLASLTVAPDRLPKGCRIAPVVRSSKGEIEFVMYPGLRENPWVGANRVTGASIRGVVDGGPPRGVGDLTGPELHARQAEGVLESYRARYLAADGSRVEVYAVRFDDPKLTLAASLRQLDRRGQPGRVIVRDATAVLVLPGSGGDCVRAVGDFIASMR